MARQFLLILFLSIGFLFLSCFSFGQVEGSTNEQRLISSLFLKRSDNTNAISHLPASLDTIRKKVLKAESAFETAKDSDAVRIFKQSIITAREAGLSLLECYLNYRLGRLLYQQGNFHEGMELLLYANQLLTPAQYANFPYAGSFLYFLGNVKCDYHDFEGGLRNVLLATKYSFADHDDELRCYGVAGLAYYRLQKADSSIYYTQRAINVAKSLNDTTELANLSGNQGAAYMLKGDYTNAYNQLNQDYSINKQRGNLENASGALILICKIHYRNKDVVRLKNALNTIDSIQYSVGNFSIAMRQEYYSARANLNRLLGNYELATRYLDSSAATQELYTKKWNAAALRSLELKVATNSAETKIQLIESERRHQLLLRNLVIAIVILALIILLMYLRSLRRKRLQERLIYDVKLKHAETQLASHIDNIKYKNQLLEKLELELNEQQQRLTATGIINADNTDEKIRILNQIKEATLITEDGWREFTKLVEVVHINFFTKLKDRLPDLTPAETRLLTLIKLKLNTREMAGLLGISPDSVKKSRQRVRKKLNLAEDENLDDFLQQV